MNTRNWETEYGVLIWMDTKEKESTMIIIQGTDVESQRKHCLGISVQIL